MLRVDRERRDWGVKDRDEKRNLGGGGEFHFCKIVQNLSPAAQSQVSSHWSVYSAMFAKLLGALSI